MSSFEALQTADRPGNKFSTAAHKRLLYKKKSVLTFSLLVEVGADLLFADDVCVGNLEETQVGEQS